MSRVRHEQTCQINQDTLFLLWLGKGKHSCLSNLTCRAVNLVSGFVTVFLTLFFALDPKDLF